MAKSNWTERQPAKARAIYLSVCLSKSDIQLPNPIPQPTRLKIKGTDACVKGRRISKLLSKKHNDDTWDTGNDIVYAPKNLPSKTQPAGFSSEPIIYWDALLNNSVVHGHRVKLVSRITAMSLEHQWRAVRVWAEWVQNKGVNIAGEQMKRQAIDVGNYLEASKEYMELLRASWDSGCFYCSVKEYCIWKGITHDWIFQRSTVRILGYHSLIMELLGRFWNSFLKSPGIFEGFWYLQKNNVKVSF